MRPPLSHSEPAGWIVRRTGAFRRANVALFLAGFASFSLLHSVQPLLPLFAREFGVSPAESSLSLSLSTGLLAVAILCGAALSDGLGRRGLMFASMSSAGVLHVAAALSPRWHLLLLVRALEGFALGGVPAVAMAWLAEEIEPSGLGFAMGLYVAGTAFGGMAGRVGTALLAHEYGWRSALAVVGASGLIAAAGFIALLPPSRRFTPRPGFDVRPHLRAWAGHLRSPALRALFAIAFLAMGAFVTIYNYAGFRLQAPPYGLTQAEVGWVFAIYLFGIAASYAAGSLTARFGSGRVLPAGLLVAAAGVALTLVPALSAVIAGVALLTIGFFGAHAVASGQVGARAAGDKGHATSLYLLAYYSGSSVAGSAGGWFWARGGWSAVALFAAGLLALALLAAVRLARP